MTRFSTKRGPWWGLLLALAFCLLPSPARAQYAGYPYPPMRGPAAEPPQPPAPCSERCFTLSRMRLVGQVGKPMQFEIAGEVLAQEPYAVPLFGTPGQVRLDGVTENGGPATIGIDGDHYFVLTSARRFTLRGTLTLGDEQSFTIAGPLNSFDADLKSGKVVEGEHLSGLSTSTLHFDPMVPDAEQPRSSAPTTFQVSRAIRIGQSIAFQYRISLTSGTDIGVVKLPLAAGESVSEVSGSTGWKVDGTELSLPVTGREAQIYVNGTLPSLQPIATDARSAYEWILVESDPEHKVVVEPGIKQVDVKQSPITPQQPGARLYLVQRGQKLTVQSRALTRGDVLAAVVREHDRLVIVTARGDMVSDEILSYENNGIDQITIAPAGKPMFLAIDDEPKRILHDSEGSKDVIVPLTTGTHAVRLQSITHHDLGFFGGLLSPPMPSHALTTSKQTVTLALPGNVHPVALFGGDKTRWFSSLHDAFAALIGLLVGLAAFRTLRTRLLGGLALATLWFVSDVAFVAASTFGLVVAGGFLASRFLRGKWLAVATSLVAVVVLSGARLALTLSSPDDPALHASFSSAHQSLPRAYSPAPAPQRMDAIRPDGARYSDDANGGMLGGATPIALSLPSHELALQTHRELVTREHPFSPRLLYVTSFTFGVFRLAWLGLFGWLVFAHRGLLARGWQRVRERLGKRPELPQPKPADWPQW